VVVHDDELIALLERDLVDPASETTGTSVSEGADTMSNSARNIIEEPVLYKGHEEIMNPLLKKSAEVNAETGKYGELIFQEDVLDLDLEKQRSSSEFTGSTNLDLNPFVNLA
jgi:hypothetical protein